MLSLTDTHAHVQMPQFADDREMVIAAAQEAGVARMVAPGVDAPTSGDALALARRYPGLIFAAVGVHPHDAQTLDDATFAEIAVMAGAPEVVAIGEIGLDYYRDLSPRETQREALARQVALARERDLPVILHNRESHADMIAELRQQPGARGVFHCFTGNQAMARDALDLGFYISIAGPVTFPKNTELAEVAAWVPLDRLLIETDCPYLTPAPYRGRRNEPGYVAFTAQRIADLRGMALDDLAAATSANAARLFRLPSLPENGD